MQIITKKREEMKIRLSGIIAGFQDCRRDSRMAVVQK
jgi:hypothetical protein